MIMESIEIQLNRSLENVKFLERQIVSLRRAVTDAVIRATTAERRHILYLSGLPQESVDRLHISFATSTDNAGLKQAINIEKRRVVTK